jgi:hypothetical protein
MMEQRGQTQGSLTGGMDSAASSATTATGLPKPSRAMAVQTGQVRERGITTPGGCMATTMDAPHSFAVDPGNFTPESPVVDEDIVAFRSKTRVSCETTHHDHDALTTPSQHAPYLIQRGEW